jgi:chorismate dehydratase
MQPQDEKFHATWDLGEEWFRWTGLPFVFAMWVATKVEGGQWTVDSQKQRNSDPQSLSYTLSTVHSRLATARDLGEKSIHYIAEREASLLNLPLATTIQYLTKNLHYRLGSAERSGLKLFYDLAVRRGLVPEGLKLVFRSHACAG